MTTSTFYAEDPAGHQSCVRSYQGASWAATLTGASKDLQGNYQLSAAANHQWGAWTTETNHQTVTSESWEAWEAFISFNTGPTIPDTDTITSATLTLTQTANAQDTCTAEARVHSFWPIDTTDWVSGPGGIIGKTLVADHAWSDTGDDTTHEFTSNGLENNVSKTGRTDLLIVADFLHNGYDPPQNTYRSLVAYSANQTGTNFDPKLVVIHAAGSSGVTLRIRTI